MHAYLNRCTHVAMELDWQPDRFLTLGAGCCVPSHGAEYAPDTGACVGGLCRGGLVSIELNEAAGVVYWLPRHDLQPVTLNFLSMNSD